MLPATSRGGARLATSGSPRSRFPISRSRQLIFWAEPAGKGGPGAGSTRGQHPKGELRGEARARARRLAAPWDLRDLLVDEVDYELDGLAGCCRALGHVALRLALEQLQIERAAGLAVLGHEPVEIGPGMGRVLGVLDVEHGRELGLLTALERDDRAALGHGVLGLPVLVVTRQHAVDDLGIRLAGFLQLLGVPVAAEGIDD